MSENDEFYKALGPVLGGQILSTEDLLEGLADAPNAELQRLLEKGRAKMNAMPEDWHAKGIRACQLLYARMLADLLSPEEKDRAERAILNLISVGGWPMHQYDIKLIRLAIIGCGFMPGRPLTYKQDAREQNDATRETA